jgi:hypothetical protein
MWHGDTIVAKGLKRVIDLAQDDACAQIQDEPQFSKFNMSFVKCRFRLSNFRLFVNPRLGTFPFVAIVQMVEERLTHKAIVEVHANKTLKSHSKDVLYLVSVTQNLVKIVLANSQPSHISPPCPLMF